MTLFSAVRRRRWLWLASACALLGHVPVVWAGAWTVPRNRWYAEYYYRYFGAKKDFDTDGHSSRKPKTASFSDIRNEWKLEYGLTDWWNVLASVPYQSSHYRDRNTDLLTTGVGDIYVRTKLRAFEDPLVGSVQFSWKIPSAYNPKESPALGDGQVDFESRLLLSRSWTFAPYQVPVPKRPGTSPAASSREQAIRDAILVAELYARGARLCQEGHYAESAKWLRAVLETEPSHVGAMRLLLKSARALAQTSRDSSPQFIPVKEEVVEPMPKSPEIDTRYAGVGFVNLEAGFTGRNQAPANEFPLFLEAGITPLKRLMVVSSVEAVISVKSTHEQTEDFAKWGVRGILNVWGDGFVTLFRRGGPSVNLELGYNDVFAGRNTSDAFEIFGKVGVFF